MRRACYSVELCAVATEQNAGKCVAWVKSLKRTGMPLGFWIRVGGHIMFTCPIAGAIAPIVKHTVVRALTNMPDGNDANYFVKLRKSTFDYPGDLVETVSPNTARERRPDPSYGQFAGRNRRE